MAKKISGEYFKENRDFIPLGSAVKGLLEGKIEQERRDTAREFIKLQENQRKSREQTFKAYGMNMPLPVISEKEYLEKHIPMDAWLYSQYGAILYPQEDGTTTISSDGAGIIIDRGMYGKSMAEINGVPQKKEPGGEGETGEPEETPSPAINLNKNQNQESNSNPIPRDISPDKEDVLAPHRKKYAVEQRKRRREKLVIRGVIGGVLVLGMLVIALVAYKLL